MKITRKASTAAVASLSLLALAACSSGSGDNNSNDSGINQSTAVNVAWESPLTSVNTDEFNVGNATQNAVVTYLTNMQFNYYDPELKLQKDTNLGTYEKTSDDPLTVKYTINKDATWSDGTPVTATDSLLEWAATSGSLNTIQGSTDDAGNDTTDYTSGVFFNGVDTGGPLVSKMPVVSSDNKTITFTYDKPFADWELEFQGPVVPAHVVAMHALGIDDPTKADEALVQAIKDKDVEKLKPVAKFWNDGFNFTKLPDDKTLLVSDGPYIISDYVEGQYLTVTRNDKYKGTRTTGPDTITFRYIDDPMGQVQALQNGEVDIIGPQASADVLTALNALSTVKVQNSVEGTYEHVDLQFTNAGPFDPATYGGDAAKALAVRKAFLTALPRQAIIDNLIKPLNPKAEVRNSFNVIPGAPNYDQIVKNNGSDAYPLAADPDKAKSILAAAGVTGPISVRFLFNADNPRRVNEFALITDSEAKAGITMADASQPADKWVNQINTGQASYDASLFGWQSTSTAVTASDPTFRTGGSQNKQGYSNAKVDSLFDQLQTETDASKQTQILTDIEKQLWADAFGTTIFQFPGIHAWTKNLAGADPISLSPTIMYGYWDWKLSGSGSTPKATS
ncbi:ABC transporter substrate-binding protein [Cellulomonas sp. McL0617]|uniref:ABC transporter family substrate-binding protein n=1 Tax=Cellulomonas sp. McL0617 TaxID=3415675 RepID=UPI003CF232DF